MKSLFTLLLFVMPFYVLAQNNDVKLSATLGKDVVVNLNGKVVPQAEIDKLSPDSIIEISVLKDAKVPGIDPRNGSVFVVTSQHAIHHYQEIFSSFSDDLESWLTSHGTDDRQFRYYINGSEVPKTNIGIGKLYNLKKENIESVTMVQDEPAGSKYAAKIKIVTNK